MGPSRQTARHSSLLIALMFAALATAFELGTELLNYIQQEYGTEARQRLETWQDLHQLAGSAPTRRQIRLVNSFFNRVPFISDLAHWNEEDFWATPVELLATNGGDCEDYSIAKYLTLRSMGVPDQQLRIVYVKALELNQAHMVLAWYPTPDADPLILDNLINQIRPASQRDDLEPVYSFNGEGLWRVRGGRDKRSGTAEQLSHWRALTERLIDPLK
ncbi:transglutaminase-like cysteine proteinase BTLCP [Marinobacter daqiaonensis]|uniref:Transglutaminase-like cysteine proteinase BTLCP n=1 Tax=Marinobacter daqiaonensis TaxID=650891 RepID=A0A1I6GP99_9GAMM|nr:transglutaminase-like cysteine peptidase [Marinobacter daqiaonensis]SFR43956.1 transglutaminase-like cysteine proteinase BTLCP [Marinobacter daqiaonensis]